MVTNTCTRRRSREQHQHPIGLNSIKVGELGEVNTHPDAYARDALGRLVGGRGWRRETFLKSSVVPLQLGERSMERGGSRRRGRVEDGAARRQGHARLTVTTTRLHCQRTYGRDVQGGEERSKSNPTTGTDFERPAGGGERNERRCTAHTGSWSPVNRGPPRFTSLAVVFTRNLVTPV